MKSIVVFSGGMDSYTLLNKVIREGSEVSAMSFDYGQRHIKELEYASRACVSLDVPHMIVRMADIGRELLRGSSQTSKHVDVPEGHYEDETMKLTVVPNRNMVMLSLAIGYAVSIKAQRVYYGAHAGDHAIYPDCRPEFVAAMNTVAEVANYEKVAILSPFINIDKGDIAILGKEMGLDYSKTWTCYKGGKEPCGKCGACQERREAMLKAGINE